MKYWERLLIVSKKTRVFEEKLGCEVIAPIIVGKLMVYKHENGVFPYFSQLNEWYLPEKWIYLYD